MEKLLPSLQSFYHLKKHKFELCIVLLQILNCVHIGKLNHNEMLIILMQIDDDRQSF